MMRVGSWMGIEPMNYHTATVRQFLTQYFSDEDLNRLCFDYFLDVYHNFTAGMTKSQKIQLLLEHCQQHGRLPNLLAALEHERPALYSQFFPAQSYSEIIPAAAK